MKKLTLPQTFPLLPVLPALLLAMLPVALSAATPGRPAPEAAKADKLAEALAARDKGDLLTAKKDFEALLVATPGSAELKRYLDDVNAKIAATPALVAKAKASEEKAAKALADKAAQEKIAAERAENDRLKGIAAAASSAAKSKVASGDFVSAASALDEGVAKLGAGETSKALVAGLQAEKADLPVQEIDYLLSEGKVDNAKVAFASYQKANPSSAKLAVLESHIDQAELHPPVPSMKSVSGDYLEAQKEVARLVAVARAQYNGGNYEEAKQNFERVIGKDGLNADAHYFLQEIANKFQISARESRETTAANMLLAVTRGWELPSVFVEHAQGDKKEGIDNKAMREKLDSIIIPNIRLNGAEVDTIVELLTDLAQKYDASTTGPKGINFIHNKDSSVKKAPEPVTLTLVVPVTMTKLLSYIAEKLNYEVLVNHDDVVLHPITIGGQGMETVWIPINQPTVKRLQGAGGGTAGAASDGAASDPFASSSAGASSSGGDAGAIQGFLQSAGVSFPTGSNLTYDGSVIIVTQTTRNIERIRTILGRYNDVKQVNIETKFLEVTEGNLTEVGINWSATRKNGRATVTTPYRSLSGAFATAAGTSNSGVLVVQGGVDSATGTVIPTIALPIINNPPTFPGVSDLANEVTSNFLNFSRVIGSFDINAVVRALERKTGTELLSSPSLTVLSGSQASIAIAQELRYPRSYSDARVQTGQGGGQNGGSGGGGSVAIASGTPQDFDTRHIGVEMKVTPIVEDDDYNISLDLAPTVTEFEGFVEYGGPNVAAGGGSTLTAPSGFFQPVFSVREITTKVEVWDGATLVMGGLTREQVKKLNDKTPILGDIPLFGRLFQSKGETLEKRNLLIFVTANLIGQGGALKKQKLPGADAGAKYENPNVSLPNGSESRRAASGASKP